MFTEFIRWRDLWRCKKCGKQYVEGQPSQAMGVSHFWPRGKESVRYDPLNADLLCNYPCHQFFESHRTEYIAWKKDRIGEKAYKLLEVRAHTTQKRDDKLQEIVISQLMKSLRE